MGDENWIDLADAIGELRVQLSKAREAAQGQDVLFTVGKAEIELEVEARREAGGGGGFKFGVVSLEGKGTASSGSKHKLRLDLVPHDSLGKGINIGDRVKELPSR